MNERKRTEGKIFENIELKKVGEKNESNYDLVKEWRSNIRIMERIMERNKKKTKEGKKERKTFSEKHRDRERKKNQ